MASKIQKELTPEAVVELLETLAKTEGGGLLRVIQAEAQRRGLQISLMSASSFRDAALKPYLERLKGMKEKSLALAEAVTGGDESGLLAAARTTLAEKVADFLLADAVEPEQFGSLAKTLSLLSGSNQGDKLTRARLAALEAKEAERLAAREGLERRKSALAARGGVSTEAIGLMEEALQLLG